MRKYESKKIIIFYILSIILFLSAFTCNKKNSRGSNKVANEKDAYRVGYTIISSFYTAAPHSDSKVWNNTTVNGYASGTAVVNGSFVKNKNYGSNESSSYDYNNVNVEFNDFCVDSEENIHVFGSGTIDGYVSCQSSYSKNSYSGSWIIEGTFEIKGKFGNKIDYYAEIRDEGMIFSGAFKDENGKTWVFSYP